MMHHLPSVRFRGPTPQGGPSIPQHNPAYMQQMVEHNRQMQQRASSPSEVITLDDGPVARPGPSAGRGAGRGGRGGRRGRPRLDPDTDLDFSPEPSSGIAAQLSRLQQDGMNVSTRPTPAANGAKPATDGNES